MPKMRLATAEARSQGAAVAAAWGPPDEGGAEGATPASLYGLCPLPGQCLGVHVTDASR
jgi:hypothetical protein